MIVKKLAVPLINEKILHQAEHCYIATAAISEAGFDFIRSRIAPKCKIEIVTGLDVLTSSNVLRRVWRNYQERISLHIYTKNFFHANLYIFDLPFRKSVAFIGSGDLSLGGVKDNEELFGKIIDPKEIETLKSWFVGYYEFATPLSEAIVEEYDLIYPAMKQREIASRQEQQQLIALTASGFNWDSIKFKNLYFKKEDYLTFTNTKAPLCDEAIQAERVNVQTKFIQLHEAVKKHLHGLRLFEDQDESRLVSSLDPLQHPDEKLRSMWLSYGRREAELKRYSPEAKLPDFMTLQIMMRQKEIGIWLMVGKAGSSKEDREHFRMQMPELEYKVAFFKALTGLGAGYWIEIAGDKRMIESFANEEALSEFTKTDDWRYYSFVIGKNYPPGDPEIGIDHIASTIMKEADKLAKVYTHMKDVSMDGK